MHILFLDESGTPPASGKQYPRYFVVGGIIIPETSWHGVRDALLGMKIRYGIRGELKWRYFAPSNDQNANPMRHLDQTKRDAIRAEMYKIICSDKSLKTIAAVCSIPAAYAMNSVNQPEDIYKLTYKVASERFQYYLQDSSKPSNKEFGIIVADHRGSQEDKRLRAHHQMLLHSSAEFTSKYGNLIESLFLHPSNLSVGIQLADMVAGAVWRKYERNDAKWFDLVSPSLRQSRGGIVLGYGMIKVPKAGWV